MSTWGSATLGIEKLSDGDIVRWTTELAQVNRCGLRYWGVDEAKVLVVTEDIRGARGGREAGFPEVLIVVLDLPLIPDTIN
jgi:hypothetical protein